MTDQGKPTDAPDLFRYTMMRASYQFLGADRMVTAALKVPGRVGIIKFCACRGDEPQAVADQLGIMVAEIDEILAGEMSALASPVAGVSDGP